MVYPRTNTYQARETGIHNVSIRGVTIPGSHQRGGLLIWGNPTYKGKNVELTARKSGDTLNACFVEHMRNGRIQYVAVFPRLEPGDYETGYFSGHSYVRISISSGYVTQLDWS